MNTARLLTRQSLRLYDGASGVQLRSSLQLQTLTYRAQYGLLSAPPAAYCRKNYSTSTPTSNTTSSPPPQNEYLIVIPDHPNTSDARAKAKPGHIKSATPLIDAGVISYCGVTLSEATEGKGQSINGSAIVMKAGSEEEVREFLERDEYTEFGVWDVKGAKIWGFRSG